jgi:hypothetical protein
MVESETSGNKKPRIFVRGFCFLQPFRLSGNQCLTGTIDHGLQRFSAGVLIGVQTLAVAGDTVFVDQCEAEAAFASGHDQAVHWSKSIG